MTTARVQAVAGRSFLVTGGAGFIGSALTRSLVARGARVRVLDDVSRGSMRRLDDLRGAVELVTSDIRDGNAVFAATRGIDTVCHLAYVNGTEFFYSRPELVLDVAVGGMLNVIHACMEHGVRDLILASSSEVYQSAPSVPTDERVALTVPDPLNPRYSYGGGKIISELLAINFGRRHFDRVAIFRPHNVYGPDMGGEHVIPQLAMRLLASAARAVGTIDLPIQGSGEETRAFVYIDDLIDGVVRIIEHGEHLSIYNVGGQDEITISSLAHEIARCVGRDITIVPSERRLGSTLRRCPDITKLRALGYERLVPLREGLMRTVWWYQDRADAASRSTAPR